jgi:hypothetical protein
MVCGDITCVCIHPKVGRAVNGIRTAFCRAHGVAHELEFKRRARDAGRNANHMQ